MEEHYLHFLRKYKYFTYFWFKSSEKKLIFFPLNLYLKKNLFNFPEIFHGKNFLLTHIETIIENKYIVKKIFLQIILLVGFRKNNKNL